MSSLRAKRITGTKDILPDEVNWWQKIEETGRKVFSLYNYKELRPPIIEEAGLFQRSLGEDTEIIQKQMFIVKRDKESYALRPEATASVVRAYLENNLDKTTGFIKLYYIGPMFRAERPQRGRLRQFHHLGCEVIGSNEPYLDVELISLAHTLLKAYSIKDFQIKINTLGCLKDKKKLIQILSQQLQDRILKLCSDCQDRFKRNVLRILDCKNETCQKIIKKLDLQDKYLCVDCLSHFKKVREGLDSLKIEYSVLPYLVRGLDYYTRTVFEITHQNLGSQDALGAGGRYDNLVSELGGPNIGAVGFALGLERLFLVSSTKYQVPSKNLVYVVSLGEEAKKQSLNLLDNLRKEGIACDTDYENRSLKGAMRRADDLGARLVLIIGEDELKKDIVTLKDMSSGEQKEVKQEDLITELESALKP